VQHRRAQIDATQILPAQISPGQVGTLAALTAALCNARAIMLYFQLITCASATQTLAGGSGGVATLAVRPLCPSPSAVRAIGSLPRDDRSHASPA
jgi:hypothetical protein